MAVWRLPRGALEQEGGTPAVAGLSLIHNRSQAESEAPVTLFFMFQGQTFSLPLTDGNESIHALKTRLLAHYHDVVLGHHRVRPADVFLTGGGKPWREEATVGTYLAFTPYRQTVTTVHVTLRQPAGCFMISLSILFTIFLACVASFFTCGCSLWIIPFLLPLLFVLPLFCL
jgi:hypothetical protein